MFKTASPHLHTIRDWLRFTISVFHQENIVFGHGSNTALDEAAYLILHILHLPLDQLEPFLDAHITPLEAANLAQVLTRRVTERVPAAYLTHEAYLGDFKFYVDERVIVPRSFIAELLREQLSPWVYDPEQVGRALDLCTGSGCLAILLAHAFPNANVDAIDLSPDALAVAHKNVSDYALADRVRLIESNLFGTLTSTDKYDVIISNPPYVDAPSVAALPPEYLHEPELALGSGDDGLDVTRIILAQAKHYLNDGGVLVVEIGHNRAALEAAYPELPFTWLEVAAGDEFVFLLNKEDLPD